MHRHRAGACGDLEHVDVAAGADGAGRLRRGTAGQGRGGAGRAAVVVRGERGAVRRDDGQVVLVVVGAGVVPVAPLRERVVGGAHDRGPGARLLVVGVHRLAGDGQAVVLEPEGVPDLVGDRVGQEVRVVLEGGGEHPGRLVGERVRGGGGLVEHADVGDAGAALAQRGRGRVGPGDQHPHAVVGVGGGRPLQLRVPRVLGGHVDLERCVVLRHLGPGAGDDVALGGGEGGVGVRGVAGVDTRRGAGGGRGGDVPLGVADLGRRRSPGRSGCARRAGCAG